MRGVGVGVLASVGYRTGMAANDPSSAGTPAGMSEGDVEGRAELASYLGKEVWPADGETLQAKAREANAPDRLQARLQSLPSGRQFANLSEVWQAFDGGVEQQRF
jgi:hypothetical protein